MRTSVFSCIVISTQKNVELNNFTLHQSSIIKTDERLGMMACSSLSNQRSRLKMCLIESENPAVGVYVVSSLLNQEVFPWMPRLRELQLGKQWCSSFNVQILLFLRFQCNYTTECGSEGLIDHSNRLYSVCNSWDPGLVLEHNTKASRMAPILNRSFPT